MDNAIALWRDDKTQYLTPYFKGHEPEDVYAYIYYGPASQSKSTAFKMTFSQLPENKIQQAIIDDWHMSPGVMRALGEYAARQCEFIDVNILTMKLYKITEDANEETRDKLKAIELMAKLKKMFTDSVVNVNIVDSIEIIIPEFEANRSNVIDVTEFKVIDNGTESND